MDSKTQTTNDNKPRKIIKIKRTLQDNTNTETSKQNEQVEPSQPSFKNEDESTLEQSKPQPKFEFKLAGKLPTFQKEESKEETKQAKPFVFKFQPTVNVKPEEIKSSDQLLSNLERQKRKPINLNMFEALESKNVSDEQKDESKAGKKNPFLVQDNGLQSKTKSSTFKKEDSVKDLPLNSQIALKVIKESQDEEEPPKPFSIFSLKGNSKFKDDAQKFSGSGKF